MHHRLGLILGAGIIGAILIVAVFVSNQTYYERILENTISNLNAAHASQLSEHLASAVAKPLILENTGKPIIVPTSLLATWVEPYYRWFTREQELRVREDAVASYVTDLAPHLNIDPTNAQFGVDSDGTLIETIPSQNGQTLDIEASTTALMRALAGDTGTTSLVFNQHPAEYSLDRLPELGITGLIGRGSSVFAGSTGSRIHNIRVGAAKFNNALVTPGEEFSFNDRLGTVDNTTGYLPELVIKGDKIVPEYGGGLCQVATTAFRAAILSGFPITERHNHSLPVHYYNPQGFDATIYPGVSDLKFINDTSGPILIQTRVVGGNLYFDFFGHTDGRVVTMDGPHQYDNQPDGSLKAVFTRMITYASGETKKESFYSSYKSPSLFQTIRNPLE